MYKKVHPSPACWRGGRHFVVQIVQGRVVAAWPAATPRAVLPPIGVCRCVVEVMVAVAAKNIAVWIVRAVGPVCRCAMIFLHHHELRQNAP